MWSCEPCVLLIVFFSVLSVIALLHVLSVAFYAIMHPCAKRCGFVAIGWTEDSLQNTKHLIYNYCVESNRKTVERFETRIVRVSDATDGCEWPLLMYFVILFSKFKWFWPLLGWQKCISLRWTQKFFTNVIIFFSRSDTRVCD
jgi:hypothetical protein